MKKKGLAPIITTMILIGLVIAIIGVIFFWFRGMVQEGVTKFGTNIELFCEKVEFDSTYEGSSLNLANTGTTPIYSFAIKKIGSGGNYETVNIDTIDTEWPAAGLKEGETRAVRLPLPSSVDTIEVSPILIGNAERGGGRRSFPCGGEYGTTINV